MAQVGFEVRAEQLLSQRHISLQEWNPDATQTITRRETKPKKNDGGNTSNASGGGESAAQAGDRGR